MIELLLGATILASVPKAVDDTLKNPPPVTREEFLALQQRQLRFEKIHSDYIGCVAEAAAWTGGDLLTTGLNDVDNNPNVKEGNVLGVNPDARGGLKFVQLGADILLCWKSAERAYDDKDEGKLISIAKWVSRSTRAGIILNNLLMLFFGKSFIPGAMPKVEVK